MTSPSQKEHIICFIDILGFKEKILKESTDFLSKYLAIKEYLISQWMKVGEKQKFKIHSISDSIIISIETENLQLKSRRTQLKHLSIAIASLQYHLASNDIWIRGGISCGKSFINNAPYPHSDTTSDSTLLYGEAFIYAYELENKHAKYPRVLLDTKLISHCGFEDTYDLASFLNTDNNFLNWKGDLIFDWEKARLSRTNPLIKNDYPLFIDYAEFLFNDFEEEAKVPSNKKEIFRDNLRKNLKSSANVYEKFRWVTDYLITKMEIKQCHELETLVKNVRLSEDLRILYKL